MKITQQMNELRLVGMSALWDGLIQNNAHHQLELIDGMVLLLQAEKENRQLRRTERLLRQARFRYQSSIEEITFDRKPGKGVSRTGKEQKEAAVRLRLSLLIYRDGGVAELDIAGVAPDPKSQLYVKLVPVLPL